MDQSQKEKYLKNPGRCPFCDSEDIEADGEYDYGENSIYQRVICNSCDESWEDKHLLVDVSDDEEFDDVKVITFEEGDDMILDEAIEAIKDYSKAQGQDYDAVIKLLRRIKEVN